MICCKELPSLATHTPPGGEAIFRSEHVKQTSPSHELGNDHKPKHAKAACLSRMSDDEMEISID